MSVTKNHNKFHSHQTLYCDGAIFACGSQQRTVGIVLWAFSVLYLLFCSPRRSYQSCSSLDCVPPLSELHMYFYLTHNSLSFLLFLMFWSIINVSIVSPLDFYDFHWSVPARTSNRLWLKLPPISRVALLGKGKSCFWSLGHSPLLGRGIATRKFLWQEYLFRWSFLDNETLVESISSLF